MELMKDDLPSEALFNRYFIEYPDWCVRDCYLGMQKTGDVQRHYGVSQELADLFVAIRDELNQVYETHCDLVLVFDEHPRLHFNYINKPIGSTSDSRLDRFS
jgi:hypothetical protein